MNLRTSIKRFKDRFRKRDVEQSLNLMILGSRRSGTSSLQYYLQEHPEIAFLQRPDFAVSGGIEMGFPYNNPFSIITARDETKTIHQSLKPKKLDGIRCVAYRAVYSIYYPHVLFNLAEFAPNLKCLMSLRNPTDATYSIYCVKWQDGFDKTFEEFLGPSIMQALPEPDDERFMTNIAPSDTLPFIARGVYFPGIAMLYHLFKRDQIHIVRFEDLVGKTDVTLKHICQFLNIDDQYKFLRIGTAKGTTRKPGPMADQTRRKLNQFFRPHNKKLLALLGWPPDTWSY